MSKKLTTDRNGNIKLDGYYAGWSIHKGLDGWFTQDFDGTVSQSYKTKKEALGATGLDWD